jgi:chromosome partitioning protein
MIITIANQKGGVGKTTSVLNIGVYLASVGKKVLLLDLDPQGNLTSGLGIRLKKENGDQLPSIYNVLIGKQKVTEVFLITNVENLYIVPANISLAGAEIELVNQISRESKLKGVLSEIKDQYDYIIIDSPPSLGLLTINALVASDKVIVPVQCEYYALEGISQLLDTIKLVKDSLNPKLDFDGIVLTMYDSRTKLSESVATDVKNFFPNQTFKSIIPRNVKLSEAPSFGKSIKEYDDSSTGANAYKKLVEEFVSKYG